jgi:catechol 2,3-dioxygenase-like lactoylglutathione lyase family enzyme
VVLCLGHLNISVADIDRSRAFYGQWFGFDRMLAEYEDGTRFIADASGFELALHPGGSAAPRRDWHFGFVASDPDAVRGLRSAMVTSGLRILEPEDTSGYVGFKCEDPDGHIVEVYFEPR